MSENTRRAEWARSWPLPLIAMLGLTGPAAYAYSSGIFMEEMTRDLGWTKTEFSSALTLQMLLGIVVGPLAARVLDRIGPRRMLLIGIVPFAIGLSLLGTTSAAMWHWWALAAFLSLATAGVILAAWISGVVQNFDQSRGLAISVCLAGIGLATAIWPPLVAWLVGNLGWRATFPAMAFGWALVLLPLTFFFYKPAHKPVRRREVAPELPPLGPVLRSTTFWFLLGAAGLFSSIQLPLIVNLVPIARLQGVSLQTAAAIAGMIGLFSIAGRIGTGILLDIVPTRPVAIGAFLLVLPVIGLLATAEGSVPLLLVAAALLGLAAGSEIDVVTYLCSRRFDPRIFGSVYTILQTGIAVCASLGPLLAGRLFDLTGSYDRFFVVAAVLNVIATALIVVVLKPGRETQFVNPGHMPLGTAKPAKSSS